MTSLDSSKSVEDKTTPIIQKVSPRTITGVLSTANKGAFDWGWQSFVAYGCHNHVVVVDTQNIKVFQTLEKHTCDITKVKWPHENYYHDFDHPYTLKLASLDSSGLIAVWNVKEGKPISTFFEPGKAALDIEWLPGRDSCQHLLLGLHPPYSIILWNTDTASKLWKKSYTETLLSFAFDPFSLNNITFLATDCILFVDDFNLAKTPSSNGRKFCISNPSSSNAANSSSEEKNKASRNTLTRRIWLLAKVDSKANSDEGVTLQECLNLTYHKTYRHHLLLLYPKEVLILDLEINQTVGIVSSEHTGSPMMQLYSCRQRDVFYILHESGIISFRLRHRGQAVMAVATPCDCSDTGVNTNDSSLEVTYDMQCQSDSLRLTKHAKVTGMTVCPLSEQKIALLVSDGRVLFIEVAAFHRKEDMSCFPPYLSMSIDHKLLNKSEKESDSEKYTFPFHSNAHHPANTLADNLLPALYHNENLSVSLKKPRFKMFIYGYLSSLSAPPHVLRMCPPVTFRNWTTYRPLMAVGNASGSIQVINMATGLIEKEYALHTSPVRGIEWIGLTSFLSYSHPNTVNNLGHVRNELVLLDLQSGRTKNLRGERSEESPIDMIRVSYLRQYVIVAFKDEPFEIWDLRQLVLLRIMPKNFPVVTALEWSPGHYKKKESSLDFSFDKVKDVSPAIVEYQPESDSTNKLVVYTKEHLVFTDTNGQLYHFSVEGNVVKHGSVIPSDQAMGSVTCIAWKGDHIVLGDVDGNLNIWNLKGKISKGISTHRGWIKKVRFGPGKGNMKILVLYSDGVDVWDVKEISFIHQIKCSREMPKVQDVDWVGSDRPILATADGCLRITDITLKQYSSAIPDYQPSDFPISPHILSTNVSFYMKSFLHHILWKQKFNTDIDQQGDSDMIWAEEQLKSLDEDLRNFLKSCSFGTAERCLHVSRIFGDQEGCSFWTLALHFLKQKKYQTLNTGSNVNEQKEKSEDGNKVLFMDQPLDTGYDFFCDNNMYKKLQLDRVRLHLSKRTTYNQTQQCAERLLLLGQTDQAVQLLLETESENSNFYEDCLRACLIATVQSSGTSQSIIKLVSTNLIASGRISEGVQLLCLIEKASDGCRYLQGSGRWDDAVWLAKVTLSTADNREILKRWVDHLCSASVDQKNKAILVLLSMHEFWKVIKFMHSSRMIERAALFLQATLEFGLLARTEENSKEMDAIFMDYSKYLLSIKNRSSAIHYCKLVSDIGDDLRKQFKFISEDV